MCSRVPINTSEPAFGHPSLCVPVVCVTPLNHIHFFALPGSPVDAPAFHLNRFIHDELESLANHRPFQAATRAFCFPFLHLTPPQLMLPLLFVPICIIRRHLPTLFTCICLFLLFLLRTIYDHKKFRLFRRRSHVLFSNCLDCHMHSFSFHGGSINSRKWCLVVYPMS